MEEEAKCSCMYIVVCCMYGGRVLIESLNFISMGYSVGWEEDQCTSSMFVRVF